MLLFTAYAGLQLSFLQADPSSDISSSRGPFTDEGVNTCQARNYVNHGKWGIAECDNLVKSPLFNAYLYGIFSGFGTGRTTSRLIMLSTCLIWFLVLALLSRQPVLFSVLLLIAGTQYHVFQFLHFTMVELMAIHSIGMGLFFGYGFLQKTILKKEMAVGRFILAFLFFYVAVLLKIQFAYALLLPPGLLLIVLSQASQKKEWWFRYGGWLLLLNVAGALLYYGAWYQPMQSVFDQVWTHQVTDRYQGEGSIWKAAFENLYTVFFTRSTWVLELAFGLTLIGVQRWWRYFSTKEKLLLLTVGLWILAESHKIFIQWLPSRYALGLFSAQALWVSVVIFLGISRKAIRNYGIGTVLLIVLYAAVGVVSLFQNRTYKGAQAIAYFERFDFKGQKVVGVWGTSLIWNSSAYVMPVWKNFLNDQEVLVTQDPVVVVTEKNEADSEGVFHSRGIILAKDYPLLYRTTYGKYDILFYQCKTLSPHPD